MGPWSIPPLRLTFGWQALATSKWDRNFPTGKDTTLALEPFSHLLRQTPDDDFPWSPLERVPSPSDSLRPWRTSQQPRRVNHQNRTPWSHQEHLRRIGKAPLFLGSWSLAKVSDLVHRSPSCVPQSRLEMFFVGVGQPTWTRTHEPSILFKKGLTPPRHLARSTFELLRTDGYRSDVPGPR